MTALRATSFAIIAILLPCLCWLGSQTCGHWPLLDHVTATPAEPAGARHAASVRSRTIMKRQSLAGTTADFSNVRLGPFLPRLTESTPDRWLKATTQLFLTLNGEENGKFTSGVQPHAAAAAFSPGSFIQLTNCRYGSSWPDRGVDFFFFFWAARYLVGHLGFHHMHFCVCIFFPSLLVPLR